MFNLVSMVPTRQRLRTHENSSVVVSPKQRSGSGVSSDFLSVPLAVSGLTVLALLLTDYLTTSIADKTVSRIVKEQQNNSKTSTKYNYYA
jgi:hypothetical protein